MSQSGFILIELMINKFSEFIEWIFGKRKKTEADKLMVLNSMLNNQFDFSIFDVSENAFDVVKIKLEKVDSLLVEDIVSSLFKISISTNCNNTFKRLKNNMKLNERILEIIVFAENRNKLSLELSNIKNSLQHKLQSNSH